MIVKKANELQDLVARILLAAGANQQTADCVAQHLVLANLSGVDTHGVWHVQGYVNAIRDGMVVPTTSPEILKETEQSALVTGNWNFGHLSARFAMELAIEKARNHQMAIVGMVQSHHIGRLGHYPEMAATQEMISMVWGGGYGEIEPAAAPYGGSRALMHTNPISMGFPLPDTAPVMFDFATSAMSGVKVNNARRRKEPLPPGCVVDKKGVPTTDPEDFFDGGAHVPFGAHKGYAIMMAAEYLGRIFCGSDAHIDPNRGGPVCRHQGVTMIVLRADIFQPLHQYHAVANEFAQRSRAIPPAPGFDSVLVPGDPEVQHRQTRRQDGIPIEGAIWQTIVDAGKSVGIKVDDT